MRLFRQFLIEEITGSGDQESPPFNTTTDSFRISYETTADRPDAPFFLNVESADPSESIGPTGNVSREGSATGETFANVPPGRYSLSIITGGATQYTVRVEECEQGGEANPGEGTSGEGASSPKTTSPAPKTSSPAPKTPSPAPKTPTPAPKDSGTLMNAGGPTSGPMPMMPNGTCPREFSEMRDGACFPS